jgi:hypothetical protein
MTIENTDSLKDILAEKVEGLFFPSETDAPIEVVSFEADSDVADTLRQRHPDKSAQVVETQWEDFYNMYGLQKDWQNDSQKQFAARFGEALDLLKENLKNVKIYRLGGVRIEIYIIGKLNDDTFVGLKTSAVET